MTIPLATVMDMVHQIFPGKYASITYTFDAYPQIDGSYNTEMYWEVYVSDEIKFKKFDSLLEVAEHLKTIYNGRRLESAL